MPWRETAVIDCEASQADVKVGRGNNRRRNRKGTYRATQGFQTSSPLLLCSLHHSLDWFSSAYRSVVGC